MKKILAIMCLLVFPGLTYGQMLHIKGVQEVGLHGGVGAKGVYGGLNYGYFLHKKVSLNINPYYEKGKVVDVSYVNMGGDVGIEYTVWNPGGRFFFNGAGGVTISSETIAGIDTIEKTKGVKAGVYVGGNIESYLGKRIALVIEGKQKFFFQKTLSKQQYQVGLSLKYFF